MSEGIRIITEPSVYLVGRQTIDDGELARFLADEGVESWKSDTEIAGQKLVEVAGRLCYQSYAKPRPGGNSAYINHILEVGHGSVTEHCVFNLIISGVSRSFTHELVRHRVGFGFSQRSQRYCDESRGEFVVPLALQVEVHAARIAIDYFYDEAMILRKSADDVLRLVDSGDLINPPLETLAGLRWLRLIERSQEAYKQLSDHLATRGDRTDQDPTSDRKAAREAARSVLLNATETKIFVTANARALRHFIEMRGDMAADAEMRRVAFAVLDILCVEAPNLFGDYRDIIGSEANPTRIAVAPRYRKV